MPRETGQGVVRLVDSIGTDSMIVHTRLGAADAKRRILSEMGRFSWLGPETASEIPPSAGAGESRTR